MPAKKDASVQARTPADPGPSFAGLHRGFAMGFRIEGLGLGPAYIWTRDPRFPIMWGVSVFGFSGCRCGWCDICCIRMR